MTNWIIKTLVSAVVVFFISWLLPGVTIEQSYLNAILVAIVIALLNSTLKPILVIFTLPATILTLGLFMWVINAVVVLAADWLLTGFDVNNFWWALLFSALFSAINSFLHQKLFPSQESGVYAHRDIKYNSNSSSTKTISGNTMKTENGKKTIIIEKD